MISLDKWIQLPNNEWLFRVKHVKRNWWTFGLTKKTIYDDIISEDGLMWRRYPSMEAVNPILFMKARNMYRWLMYNRSYGSQPHSNWPLSELPESIKKNLAPVKIVD